MTDASALVTALMIRPEMCLMSESRRVRIRDMLDKRTRGVEDLRQSEYAALAVSEGRERHGDHAMRMAEVREGLAEALTATLLHCSSSSTAAAEAQQQQKQQASRRCGCRRRCQ